MKKYSENKFKYIVIVNLLITILTAIIASSFKDFNMLMTATVPIQSSLNFFFSIIFALFGKKEEAQAFLLSAGLAVLIGFSFCVAII